MYPRSAPTVQPRPTSATDLKFPAMPQTLTEVMRLRAQGTPDVDRLVEIVKKDPGITARVLRRVNSAAYGLSRKIVQVEKAVNLLGYRDVYGLVLAAVVKQAFTFRGTDESAALYRHIMRGSVATAAAAKLLAEQMSPMLAETSFTAGLLYQLGRLVLLGSVPRPYTELWTRLSPTRDLKKLVSPSPAMERFLFKTDYARIGVALAHQWGLPEEMQVVMLAHQDPASVTTPFHRTLALLVAIGQAVSTELFENVNQEEEIEGFLNDLRDVRGVNVTVLTTLLDERRGEIRDFAEAMIQD